MKIFYTKEFKEVLEQPYKQISLGKVKLRGGTNTGLGGKITSAGLNSNSFLYASNSISPNSDSYYNAEFVRYDDGVQIHLKISQIDQSLYMEDFFYQVILFFYTDNTKTNSTPKTSLAFVLFENTELSGGNLVFKDLKLSSSNNIFTIPGFSWNCDLDLNQSEFTSFLENPWGQDKNFNAEQTGVVLGVEKEGSGKYNYISLNSWNLWMVDQVSEEENLDWLETTYINKFGLKIY